ncbi:META domain-containing protein [Antarcticimicrobium luteum]|uniref:META domain-containing protein n=1 Tax=Antarcticimicrobium luteum TaxID=2547397 RepID=A0A4R5V4L1_9RHOB|nr:META domain-containing protein [Antarcticimicrobium luteum]TDK46734.1 META domain-containing protein [Antarcticimicrobium luteum]
MRLLFLIALLGLDMCAKDETVAGFGAADRVWHLAELDGSPFPATATLAFPEPGQIAGEAPCNRYSGVMTTPYPWFDAGQLLSTRRACPELEAEQAFLSALTAMTEAEVATGTLILRNAAGREMVFRSAE